MDEAEWKQYSEAEQTQLADLALWDKANLAAYEEGEGNQTVVKGAKQARRRTPVHPLTPPHHPLTTPRPRTTPKPRPPDRPPHDSP